MFKVKFRSIQDAASLQSTSYFLYTPDDRSIPSYYVMISAEWRPHIPQAKSLWLELLTLVGTHRVCVYMCSRIDNTLNTTIQRLNTVRRMNRCIFSEPGTLFALLPIYTDV